MTHGQMCVLRQNVNEIPIRIALSPPPITTGLIVVDVSHLILSHVMARKVRKT